MNSERCLARILAVIAIFTLSTLMWACDNSDSEEDVIIPWGQCGPRELEQAFPKDVQEVAFEFGYGNTTCEPDASVTFSRAYLTGNLDYDAADEGQDNFIEFSNQYWVIVYCDGIPLQLSEVRCDGQDCRQVGSLGNGGGTIGILEEKLDHDYDGCNRGLFHINPVYGASFYVITPEPGKTYIYPSSGADGGIWGEGEDIELGDFHFTKEEFFAWWKEHRSDFCLDCDE